MFHKSTLLATGLAVAFGMAQEASAQIEIVLYDGAVETQDFFAGESGVFAGGFTFEDFDGQVTDGPNSFTITNDTDVTGTNGLFGGVGRDAFGVAVDAEVTTATVTFSPNVAGTNEFRLILVDAGAVQFQYGFDPATFVDLGNGMFEATVAVGAGSLTDDFDDSILFVSGPSQNVAPDFSNVSQWQIQSVFNGADPLNIEVSRVVLNTVPEPGSLALLSLGALGLVARRR